MLHRKPEEKAALIFSCLASARRGRSEVCRGWGGRLSGRVNTVKLSVKLCKTLNKKLLIVTQGSPPFPFGKRFR